VYYNIDETGGRGVINELQGSFRNWLTKVDFHLNILN
jgi:hypothetical protein